MNTKENIGASEISHTNMQKMTEIEEFKGPASQAGSSSGEGTPGHPGHSPATQSKANVGKRKFNESKNKR